MPEHAVSNVLRDLIRRWNEARISRVGLGKYIILLACLLDASWALLLRFPGAGAATPLSLIVRICGGPGRAAIVLTLTSAAAIVFPFRRYGVSVVQMGLHLIPQQVVLLVSALGGARAIVDGHYADGVERSSAFIAADQLPIILLALLYTVVVLEVARGLRGRHRQRLGEG